jgi:hypothetical protein
MKQKLLMKKTWRLTKRHSKITAKSGVDCVFLRIRIKSDL